MKAADWIKPHLESLIAILEKQPFQYDWSLLDKIDALITSGDIAACSELFSTLDDCHKEYMFGNATTNVPVMLALHKKFGQQVALMTNAGSAIDREWGPALKQYIAAHKDSAKINIAFVCEDAIRAYKQHKRGH